MANIPIPVFRINGTTALVTFLYMFTMFGALHLLALAKPDTKWAKALLALGF